MYKTSIKFNLFRMYQIRQEARERKKAALQLKSVQVLHFLAQS